MAYEQTLDHRRYAQDCSMSDSTSKGNIFSSNQKLSMQSDISRRFSSSFSMNSGGKIFKYSKTEHC